jgi:hypothetical protein
MINHRIFTNSGYFWMDSGFYYKYIYFERQTMRSAYSCFSRNDLLCLLSHGGTYFIVLYCRVCYMLRGLLNIRLFRLPNLDIPILTSDLFTFQMGCTTGATGRQGILTPSWHLISALMFIGLFFDLYTVPTKHNLTPERTQSEPGVRTLGSLCVRFSKFCVRSGSALRSLWVSSAFALGSLRVRYLGALYALMREADPAFILPPVSPAPCIFQTFTQ